MKTVRFFCFNVTVLLVVSLAAERTCPLGSYCAIRTGDCQNFADFRDLAFDSCLQDPNLISNIMHAPNFTFEGFKFFCPNNQPVLNQFFDITSVITIYSNFNSVLKYQPFNVNFYSIAGIDILMHYDKQENEKTPIIFSTFHFSRRFNLYKNGEMIKCQNLLPTDTLANLFHLFYDLTLEYIQFDHMLCSEAFRNVSLYRFSIRNSVGLRFDAKRNASDDLHISITNLEIDSPVTVKYVLDRSVLSPDMFKQTQSITLDQLALYSIQPVELFQEFYKLKSLTIKLNNMKSFLHNNDPKWMNYLNYYIRAPATFWNPLALLTTSDRMYVENFVFILSINCLDNTDFASRSAKVFPYILYDFPDEDFCLFVNFPHKQLVIMQFFEYTATNVTCTMVSLLQHLFHNYKAKSISLYRGEYPQFPNFDGYFKECDIETRTKQCNITSIKIDSHDPYFDVYDIKIGIDGAKEILLTYLGPSLSFFGVVTNSLLIAVILHNKIKYKNKQTITMMNKSKSKQLVFLLDEPLYKYMLINAVLSLVYCSMYLLDLTIPCVPGSSGPKERNCRLKDIVIGFFGSSLKLLSNVMVLEMAINRYTLLGKDHAKFLLNLAGLNIKKVFLVSLVLSFILNTVTVFQDLKLSPRSLFQSQADKLTDSQYNTYIASDDYWQNLDGGPNFNDVFFIGFTTVMIFSIIYHQLSDTLFCIISLILDILTLKRLRQVLNEHAKIAKGDDEAKKKRAAEVKGFWMVFAFNLTNALIRLPDLITSVFLIVGFSHPEIYYSLCAVFSSCLTLGKLTNVFYIFSLSINFFLYNAFYSTFRECFSDFIETLSKKAYTPKSY